ncbi:unnamed protein product [Acanthoscelides obtectus]|nr:unnamed protein product [Acanthoscelides obtectus]CAK1625463.1 SH3 domain-binding protein 5 homolog [Acanthoscelides obtectus]
MLLNESTRRLKLLSKRLGSCIDKSRLYYELLDRYKEAQAECQRAAALYKKAHGVHAAAKETVALAEQRFLENRDEWQFDNAWQEMLNHATMKVMEAENEKAESGREHQRRAKICADIEEKLKHEEEKAGRAISKARAYFDEKQLCQEQLNTQKERIESLKRDIIAAKQHYSQTLKNLEQISNEIHEKRRDVLLRGPREPGVGAELNVAFHEGPHKEPAESAHQELPDIANELDKCYIRRTTGASSVNASSATSDRDGNETDDDLDSLEVDSRTAEGKSEDVYVSEYQMGPLSPAKIPVEVRPKEAGS